MVRGLIIRQLFLVLNLALTGLILFTAGAVILQLARPPKSVELPPTDPGAVSEGTADTSKALRERTAYNGIVENGLFGDAGRFKVDAVVEAPVAQVPVDAPEEETKLSLKLWAVTSLSPKSPFASASIEDTAQKAGSQLFHIGNPVVENVILEEVHPRWVVLINNNENPPKRERLSMDDEEGEGEGTDGAAQASRGRSQATLPPQEVELDKNTFVQELLVNYSDLITKVKPELYRDASGKVAGITAADISEVPLAKQLGLENGDVLQTVNNEQIDSEQKIMEMVQKYQDAGSFRIGVMRNGKQKIITYNFR